MARRKRKRTRGRRRSLAGFALGFGRYAGRPLGQVPRRYLEWAAGASIPAADKWVVRQWLTAGD